MGINLKRHRGADSETICSRELAQKGSLVCPGFLVGGINNIVVLAKSGWVHNIVAPLRDISAMAKMAAKDDGCVRDVQPHQYCQLRMLQSTWPTFLLFAR